MTKYEYLFDVNDKLVHHSEAIRLNEYRLYPGETLDYIYKQGDEREYFAKKIESTNVFGLIGIQERGIYGETPEHYNAKMKIVHEKKYFDTIFNQWIEFDNVVPEFYHEIKKRPDLSCYDENDNLVCCIEICWSNAKTEIDIFKLKQLNVPIIEINVKNDNRCKHLILPILLEVNRQKLADINFKLQEFEQEQQQLETEYNRLADQLQEGSSRITTDIKYFEINFKGEVKRRLDRIDNWLQRRLKRFAVEDNADQKIKHIEREFKRIKNEGEKRDYRIGKLESEVKSVESKINKSRQSFNQIAEQSKIEWFRNSWMSYSPQNVVEEIKYWLS
jgi:hypothetical protein